jgi:phage terminase large subunit
MATTELYDLVPHDLLENLEFRKKLWTRAHSDLTFQADMMKACREDILFWLGAFAWVYEPRPRLMANGKLRPSKIPFVPWPHQIPVILDIRHNIGMRDVIVKKSRGEGMSWIGILMAIHDWLFFSGRKVGLVSRTELMADDPGNYDSLLAKVDLELEWLPKWMAGLPDIDFKRDRNRHSFVNFRNGSQINAFAATSNTGRAGRYTWFMPRIHGRHPWLHGLTVDHLHTQRHGWSLLQSLHEPRQRAA